VYSILAEGHIKLVDLGTNTTKNLLALADVTDEHGAPLSFASWRLSADMRHVLVKADVRKQWRHSSHGNYYVHDLAAKTTRALLPPTYPPATAYAAWAPAGDALAYVHANDLYVVPTPDAPAIRVTAAGNASLFHGVPDWVYEEEVFQSDFALWWAPDAKALAFLRLDETKVPEYAFPVYNPTNNASIFAPYPGETVMKYPKPGYDNPLVSVHIFDVAGFLAANKTAATAAPAAANFTAELTWPGAQAPTDQVIQEVAWVGPATLIIKDVNRAATNGSVVLFDLAGPAVTRATGAVVRALGVQDGGWIDAAQTVFPLPAALAPAGGGAAYLDIVPSSAGFNHLALFWPASARDPLFLTNGSWEVTDRVAAVDTTRALVYFVAAAPSSFERHVYSVPLPSAARPALAGEPVLFTSAADGGPAAGDVGYYSADFSPAGGFALLNYQGPNVPWQRVLSTRNSSAVDYVLTENRLLNQTLRQFELPIVSRYTLENEGFGQCIHPCATCNHRRCLPQR
jgi:dipeptidyl aminopeptidase